MPCRGFGVSLNKRDMISLGINNVLISRLKKYTYIWKIMESILNITLDLRAIIHHIPLFRPWPPGRFYFTESWSPIMQSIIATKGSKMILIRDNIAMDFDP